MMKISKIDTTHLRNEAYFQFHSKFRSLVVDSGAEALKIELQFNFYLPLYERMNEAFKKIVKSEFTAKIHKADKARGEIWAGMTEMNFACLKHFNPQIKAAAARLQTVFDSYGNLANKPAKEETAAIYNVLQELHSKYESDMIAVGIQLWAVELKNRNVTFEALVKGRSDETASKSGIVLRKARVELDVVYRAIVDRVNALIVVEGDAAYEQFAKKLNEMISKYAVKRNNIKTPAK